MVSIEKNTSLYNRYFGMRDRCLNVNAPAYKNYGGRGIKMSKRWLENKDIFYKWAKENGYKPELHIDRINNNRGYYPNNCRWVTRSVNNKNRRRCKNIKLYEYAGQKHPIPTWSKLLDIKATTLRFRLKMGYSFLESIETPPRARFPKER